MNSRVAGTSLITAALLFWLSWVLMPGVGVTDAERILELVASHRLSVAASVVAQLLSAVLYVPALLGIVTDDELAGIPSVRWGAGLLLVGAMGSAADAVFHLLAYAMTAPGLETASLERVMAFMQGPGLLLLAPLILCFFIGGAWLSLALANAGAVSPRNAHLHGVAVLAAVLGGALGSMGMVPPRLVGRAVLGVVSAAQIWVGVAVWSRGT